MQTRANGADGAFKNLSGFFIAALFEEAEDDGLAKFDGEVQDGGADQLAALEGFQSMLGSVVLNGQRVDLTVIRGWFNGLHLLGGTFKVLHDAVARDAIEKGRQGAALAVELLGIAYQNHEHVLNDFLCSPCVAGHAQSKAIESCLITTIKQGKGFFVALGGPA